MLWSLTAACVGCGGEGGAGVELPSLRVSTATSGVELDPDGYTVIVDGGPGRAIGLEATVEIGSLEDGPHAVELQGVAPNCQVEGTHPRTVQTSSGSTENVRFEVECRPGLGEVRVVTRTQGEDRDEDGYVVVVDGEARPIGLNSSLTYENVPAGPVVAEILGVASNCNAASETYHEVTVLGGASVDVTFTFDCSPRQPETGSVQVAVATSGPSPDPDGYTVSVDGGLSAQVAASGTVLLTGLPIGARTIALSGIAANCAVSGANPRSVTVSGTELGSVAFAIACTQPPTATGTLRLSTTTRGEDLDPTGYVARIDGGAGQPIGVNASMSIAGLAAGAHTIALEDLTPNCTVSENPRAVSVPADGHAEVTFTVTCEPATGTIATTAVTTGVSVDADGYVARVNGGAGKTIPANGTVTRAGLAPGAHTVQLDNVAGNCQVQGDNPRAVVVTGNETTAVTFEIICAATAGRLNVEVTGLPAGIPAQVTVTGPDGFNAVVVATTTLGDLAPGDYTVVASSVAVGGETYRPGSERQTVAVSAGAAPTVAVAYGTGPGGSLNLRIAGLYITQGTQTPDGGVPLIEGRDGFLRVFVTANGDNVATPPVRVRLYDGGAPLQTFVLPAPAGSTPTLVQEEPLTVSWNIRVPAALIRRGLSVLADVDPEGAFAESNEGDNSYPSDGTPLALSVRPTPMFSVRLVPVQLGSGGKIGDVSPANLDRYLDASRRLHPLPGIDATLRGLFTSSLTPEQAGHVNAALSQALSELLMARAVDGSERYYYGVTHRDYSSGGIAGLGYLGRPAALGWDDPDDAGWTAAHEFGHNWGRYHSPCGGPSNTDPGYPYVGGVIGVYGFDLSSSGLIAPTIRDLMSYCWPRWVSDYTYRGVMAYRAAEAGAAEASRRDRSVQPSLVVWGRIQNGRPVLEPAFLVDTRPSLPARPGRYRLEGLDGTGSGVFSLSFDAAPVGDALQSEEHFAFAVPISLAAAARLSRLRLHGPTGTAQVVASAPSQTGPGRPMGARRVGGRVEVRWDHLSAPMAMVRDATTGEVLGLAREGRLDLQTSAADLEVHLSNGPTSRRVTLPVAP